MRSNVSSFTGDVTLSHSRTSVRDLVARIVDPVQSESATDEPPLVIPSLQREFCWDADDIEKLFDSLLRGLPVGSLLMWNADERASDAKTEAKYRFIRNYANHSNFPADEADRPVSHHSSKVADPSEYEEYTFALDGQQRLTSLLIGLRGSYYEHRYRKHTDKINSYHQKELCLNLLQDPNREPEDAQEHLFEFEFRRESRQGHDEDTGAYWWPIAPVWDIGEGDLTDKVTIPPECLDEGTIPDVARQNLSRLQAAITAEQIPCEEVRGMRSEEALELFVRRNKGGEELSNSDIAFSLITVYWEAFEENEDPKDVFESQAANLSEAFGSHSFGFGKGFLIRALLYLSDERPSFERENLVPDTIGPLEEIWGDRFFAAIRLTFNLITKDFGLTAKCVSGKTSLLPILYYCWNALADGLESYEEIPKGDRFRMEYWIELTVLNNIFTVSSSMSVLHNVRPLVKESDTFPVTDIVEKYRGGSVRLGITNEPGEDSMTVEELVTETDHSSDTTVRNYLLTKLYDDRGVGEDFEVDGEVTSIEVDHFFPASKLRNNDQYLDNRGYALSDREFEEFKNYCEENVNRFGNFTLLPHGIGNQSKGEKDPKDWLESTVDNPDVSPFETHQLPALDSYEYTEYQEFLEKREPKLIEKLNERLVTEDMI